MTTTLVVARFDEDIRWTRKAAREQWLDNIIVYNKGPVENIKYLQDNEKIKTIQVTNEGREGGTYLKYIIDNYDALPDKIWFTQGCPFVHSPDFMNLLSESSVQIYSHKSFQPLTCQYTTPLPIFSISDDDENFIQGNQVVQYYINSSTQQTLGKHAFFDFAHFLKVAELNLKIPPRFANYFEFLSESIGVPAPQKVMPYCWSAIFFVSKKAVLRHPKCVYEKLKAHLYQNDPVTGGVEGYALERFWQYLFTLESWKT
mgnify:CR=1 FL=1